MGASFSAQISAESNMELRKHVDAAVTNVILDSNFTDLLNLENEKYCNHLVKIAATAFQQNKDTVDLELLREMLYKAREKNVDDRVKTSEKHHNKKTPRVQNVKKKCIQISKFYVLFAHLFSCIISTINPSFKIESNKEKTSSKEEKEKETRGVHSGGEGKSSLDFCSSRIDALVNSELNETSDGDLLAKPNVCKTNVSKSGEPLRFTDLPGMKALKKLYNLNLNDGSEMEKEDARYLYPAFTGMNAPDNIRRLDQIPLKIYTNYRECQKGGYNGGETTEESEKKEERRDKERREFEKNQMFYRDNKKNQEENIRTGIYLNGVVGSLKERLFSEYVQHIKEMIKRAESNRSILLEILSEMFVYTYDGAGNIDGVIINPSLTYKKLQSLVVRTRRIVIKLYTDCEEDYKTGLDIFFAMVQEKIILKLSVQEEVLKKQLEDVIYGPPERYIPESLLYQQQYQGMEEFNKKQFIPLHFKSSVISIVKNKLNLTSDNEFKVILPALEAWINEEMENTTTLLDPQKVAEEFLRENDYSDEYGSPPNQSEYEYVAPSSASFPPVSPPPVSPPPASSSFASSAPASSAPASSAPASSSASFAPASSSSASTSASTSFAPAILSSRAPLATPYKKIATISKTSPRQPRRIDAVNPTRLLFSTE